MNNGNEKKSEVFKRNLLVDMVNMGRGERFTIIQFCIWNVEVAVKRCFRNQMSGVSVAKKTIFLELFESKWTVMLIPNRLSSIYCSIIFEVTWDKNLWNDLNWSQKTIFPKLFSALETLYLLRNKIIWENVLIPPNGSLLVIKTSYNICF